MSGLAIDWLGTVAYAQALALQHERVEARRAGAGGDQIWLAAPRARGKGVR